MQSIYNRVPALPQSYIDEILAGADAPSQLELLEANVAADNHLLSTIGGDIKRNYRIDTVNTWANDSLINFIGRQNTLSAINMTWLPPIFHWECILICNRHLMPFLLLLI